MIHGWRGKIGLLAPPGAAVAPECWRLAPKGVTIITTRMPLPEVTPEALARMVDHIEDYATLLSQAKVDVILFCCTSGSLIKGMEYDKELISKIERHVGIPTITTSTALIESLNTLKVKSVVVATPYPNDINQLEKSFLEDSGFKVTAIKGLGLLETHKYALVQEEQMYRLAKEIFTEDADAIFISCTGISVLDIIEPLEKDLKRPVITSIQVSMWAALRKLNVNEKIEGRGKLFIL